MAYQVIEDFAAGIDLRRSPITAKPGTLRELSNGVVTGGGEIAKRQAFTSLGFVGSGTHGLGYDGVNVAVFSENSSGNTPEGVVFRRLNTPSGETVEGLRAAAIFNGKFLVMADTVGSGPPSRIFYDGTAVGPGAYDTMRVHRSKVYAADSSRVKFSAVGSASDWDGTGSGIIDISQEDSATGRLMGLAEYYGKLALFTRSGVQIWAMDVDPAQSARVQTLDGIGLFAHNGLARFATGDVLFLSDTGVRSLRARYSSEAATLSDVGAPIDTLIRDRVRNFTRRRHSIYAVTDPQTGRFLLFIGDEVFVLSQYPGTNVAAWSRWTLPAPVDYVVVANTRIVVRTAQHEILVYGPDNPGMFNADGNTVYGAPVYDSTPCVVELPYVDAGDPAANKHWVGVDISATGTWEVEANPDYYNGEWERIAVITGNSWHHGRVPLDMQSSHLALRFKSRNPAAATLGSIAVHYQSGERG